MNQKWIQNRAKEGGWTKLFPLFAVWLAVGCTGQSAKSRFLLAEKLWHEGNYAASVQEYERVIQKEGESDLALQATYRAAMTETLFLKEHVSAIGKFNRIVDLRRNSGLALEASRQIGEILYSRLEQHEQSATHYSKLLETFTGDPDVPEWMFRLGKSQFHLLKFDESLLTYRKLIQLYPQSSVVERARFEIGVSLETKAHQQEGPIASVLFREAISEFEKFMGAYPQSAWVVQAQFEIASCLEDLGQADKARQNYEAIRSVYPAPQVIQARLHRLDLKKPKKAP